MFGTTDREDSVSTGQWPTIMIRKPRCIRGILMKPHISNELPRITSQPHQDSTNSKHIDVFQGTNQEISSVPKLHRIVLVLRFQICFTTSVHFCRCKSIVLIIILAEMSSRARQRFSEVFSLVSSAPPSPSRPDHHP